MSKKIEVETVVIGLLVGGLVSFGTYFLLPPPQDASASELVMAKKNLRSPFLNSFPALPKNTPNTIRTGQSLFIGLLAKII